MEHDEPIKGWMSPVRQAMAEPRSLLMGGIPQGVCAGIVMGTVCGSLLWWRSIFLGGLVYLICVTATQWEVQWWDMLKRYLTYHQHYEG